MQKIVFTARPAAIIRNVQGSAILAGTLLFSSITQAGFTDGLAITALSARTAL